MSQPWISDDPTIVALGTARQRVEQARAYGRAGGLFDLGTALGDYCEALRDCPLDAATLATAEADLTARLERGLAAAASPAVEAAFLMLLRRLEAVVDAAAASVKEGQPA